jgi:hypothetical protein
MLKQRLHFLHDSGARPEKSYVFRWRSCFFREGLICPWWWSNGMWSMRECWVWPWSS